MIYNVELVSGDSKVIQLYMYAISILFQTFFPRRLLQSIEQSPLCYAVGPSWLSVLDIVVGAW